MPDETRRAAIIERASQIFREEGYAKLTTDAVAARCQMSKSTLYQMFPSKKALMAAIIAAHRQHMIALPGDYDHLPLAEALDRIFCNDLDEEADRERFAFLQFLFGEADAHPELHEIAEEHGRREILALVTAWIAGQQSLGRMTGPQPDIAARILMDMAVGAVARQPNGRMEWLGSAYRRAYLRSCFDVFLHGVVTR